MRKVKGNNSKFNVSNAKVIGNNNTITGNGNVIKGNNNRVEGDNNVIKGNNNVACGDGNSIERGNNNNLKASKYKFKLEYNRFAKKYVDRETKTQHTFKKVEHHPLQNIIDKSIERQNNSKMKETTLRTKLTTFSKGLILSLFATVIYIIAAYNFEDSIILLGITIILFMFVYILFSLDISAVKRFLKAFKNRNRSPIKNGDYNCFVLNGGNINEQQLEYDAENHMWKVVNEEDKVVFWNE